MIIVSLAWPTQGTSLLLGLAYPLQAIRIARRYRKLGMSASDAKIWGCGCTLCRWPNALGVLRYWFARLSGRSQTLIEYKGEPFGPTGVETRDSTKPTKNPESILDESCLAR